jgi:hypothetical protein
MAGDRLASELPVQFHKPQFVVLRAARVPEVSREHADQVPGLAGQGSRLDRPETRSVGYRAMPRESRIGGGVRDDRLGTVSRRPPASGVIVNIHHSEIVEEIGAEAGLGDDRQGT